MRGLDIDLPVARLTRLAQIVEAEVEPAWPFMQRPEFVAGSCVRFSHKGVPVATATASDLQRPIGARDPWYVWLDDLKWVAD